MVTGRILAVFLALASVSVTLVCGQGGPQTPLNLDNCQATIISTLNYTPGLARLARRINSLNGAIPQLVNAGVVITFFAPSNPAMTAFDAALADAHPQLSDVEKTRMYTQLLQYHLLPHVLDTTNMTAGQSLTTKLEGREITVASMSAQVHLKGAASGSTAIVQQPNVVVCRSVMHVVDTVLLPISVAQLAAGRSAVALPPSTPAPMGAPRPGVTPTASRNGQLDATEARAANSTASGAAAAKAPAVAPVTAPGPAPGAARATATSGALCLLAAAVAASLLMG